MWVDLKLEMDLRCDVSKKGQQIFVSEIGEVFKNRQHAPLDIPTGVPPQLGIY